ncbi:pseudouridine synthase [Polluticaenibacter yanchengensis]|uniref:Pseudouridine synthase n=1 Tax=Polluticaenibacter yanchengensis TaxID=3014562 RepID=A0ABT4UGG0_9BACT|nr:pseudouridine synthase [Chitinophagaceae bacterium LY-5]
MAFQCYIINKPFQVLTAFTSADGKKHLGDLFKVPKDVYPVGRLDYDSEGLLILTNDKQLTNRLLNPEFAHKRSYWVQVEGDITEEAIAKLSTGIEINVNGIPHNTQPAKAVKLKTAPDIPERNPPVRFRENIPTSWLSLTLTEGKNRQVRRMTAAVGFPTLRLIRYKIEQLTISALKPGEISEISRNQLYKKLGIS